MVSYFKKDLQLACLTGDYQFLKILLSSNTDFNINNVFDKTRNTLLHYLVEQNNKNKNCENYVKMAGLLLSLGASVSLRNKFGDSPLSRSIKCGLQNMLELFLQQQGVNLMNINSKSESAIFIAVDNNRNHMIEPLVRYGCQMAFKKKDPTYHQMYYLLCTYIMVGDYKRTESIAQSVIDVDFMRIKGESPLFFAVHMNNKKIVELLLARGADINCRKNENHRSILSEAVRKSSLDIVELLLNKGCGIDCGSLHLAIDSNRIDVIKLFLDRSSNKST